MFILKRLPTSPGVLKRLPTSPGVLKSARSQNFQKCADIGGAHKKRCNIEAILSHFSAFYRILSHFIRILSHFNILSHFKRLPTSPGVLKRLPTSPGVLKRLPTSPGVLKSARSQNFQKCADIGGAHKKRCNIEAILSHFSAFYRILSYFIAFYLKRITHFTPNITRCLKTPPNITRCLKTPPNITRCLKKCAVTKFQKCADIGGAHKKRCNIEAILSHFSAFYRIYRIL
jgi:hypothetical protein